MIDQKQYIYEIYYIKKKFYYVMLLYYQQKLVYILKVKK